MGEKTRKVDYRIFVVFLVFVLVAVSFGALVLHIIREHFPHLSADTLWDEFSVLPAVGLITFVATKTLIVQRTFHLYITNINPTGKIFVEMKRRDFGLLSWYYQPESMLEYKTKSSQKDLFVRNVSWFGIRGIDQCEFMVHHSPDRASRGRKNRDSFYHLYVPYAIMKDYISIYMDLACLSENSRNIITREHLFKKIYVDEISG